ncbi:zinc-finger-containing protein [Methylobacterium iners]|uniref:Uncharacterized protein n=1 Tax=Methylobacterium iners TaxID=418707 RepID=A0ABQ4RRU4_9HYPH|nr:zinc-finger-containing protein [Methylobacterium iners]GJD92878.1 hypothetical protein OCOJLMKI_0061 [Methylobacterium iners]
MTGPFCADCGTEAQSVLGMDAGLRDPSHSFAQVWSCGVCQDAWCLADPDTGAPIGTPAGPETRNARELLQERRLDPIIRQAGNGAGAQKLAASRLVGFLADKLELPREAAEIACLDLEQCRAAWKALSGVDYDQVAKWARTERKRPAKPKPLPAPTMQERATAAEAARALRAALAEPAEWGEPGTMHADLARPRRGMWFTTWSKLPGLLRENDRYSHECLPGWTYSRDELAAEMIPDLEALAERGVRPTQATTPATTGAAA